MLILDNQKFLFLIIHALMIDNNETIGINSKY